MEDRQSYRGAGGAEPVDVGAHVGRHRAELAGGDEPALHNSPEPQPATPESKTSAGPCHPYQAIALSGLVVLMDNAQLTPETVWHLGADIPGALN